MLMVTTVVNCTGFYCKNCICTGFVDQGILIQNKGGVSMKRNDLLLAVFVMAIWGFNFSMIKMGVTNVHPLLATAARFSLAVIPVIFFVARPNVAWRYLVSYGFVFGV
ncbi:hypothetical protein AB4567_26585, partial [Vibrio sp. 10N.222.51.A6]